jgi:hypothetical protein
VHLEVERDHLVLDILCSVSSRRLGASEEEAHLNKLSLLPQLVLPVLQLGSQNGALGGNVLQQARIGLCLVTEVCELVLGLLDAGLERALGAQGLGEVVVELSQPRVVAGGGLRWRRLGLFAADGECLDSGGQDDLFGFEGGDAIGELGAWE